MRREAFPRWAGSGQRHVDAASLTAVALWWTCAATECGAALVGGSIALAANAVGHFERASAQLLLLRR